MKIRSSRDWNSIPAFQPGQLTPSLLSFVCWETKTENTKIQNSLYQVKDRFIEVENLMGD